MTHTTPKLLFVVEYRRKKNNQTEKWIPMAAFDHKLAADKYSWSCVTPENPWEYRVMKRKEML